MKPFAQLGLNPFSLQVDLNQNLIQNLNWSTLTGFESNTGQPEIRKIWSVSSTTYNVTSMSQHQIPEKKELQLKNNKAHAADNIAAEKFKVLGDLVHWTIGETDTFKTFSKELTPQIMHR